MISSSPTFLSSGHTTATFHLLQNSPSPSDKLAILVTVGSIEGSSCLNICVGIGLISQDFDFIVIIMALTSDSVIGANHHSFGVPLLSEL